MSRKAGDGKREGERAFSLLELLVMIAVIVVLAGLMMPRVAPGQKGKAQRIKCFNNLKNVGLAFRIFATDNGDMFPAEVMVSNGVELASIDVVGVYGSLSNELSTPKILLCPEDQKKIEAASFTNFSATNISYFGSISAKVTLPQAFLAGDRNMATNGVAVGTGLLAVTTNTPVSWTKDLHVEHGNIAMGDGSVQQMSSAKLRNAVGQQDLATNYLVFP